jgi:hypothetical protein
MISKDLHKSVRPIEISLAKVHEIVDNRAVAHQPRRNKLPQQKHKEDKVLVPCMEMNIDIPKMSRK